MSRHTWKTRRLMETSGLLMLVVLATLVSGAPTTQAGSGPAPGTLRIHVSDATSGTSVAGATVSVRGKNGQQAASGTTDAQGAYSLQLEQGEYQVTVAAQGYLTSTSTVRIRRGQTTSLGAALHTAATTNPTPTPTPTSGSVPFLTGARTNIAHAARSSDYDVYVTSPDGSTSASLTPNTSGSNEYDPAWSPDGSKLVFVSDRTGVSYLYLMNADGSGVRQLTAGGLGTDLQPAWSPDGTRIAFASKRDGSFQIWVINGDGTGLKRLTSLGTIQQEPSWSPDGGRLVFVCGSDLCFVNADGSGLAHWFHSSTTLRTPDWSPDGTRIIFSSRAAGGRSQMWVRNVDGSGGANLSDPAASYDDREPTWSADGSQLAFVSDRVLNAPRIFRMRSDGSGATQISSGASDISPDW
jgi:dipeptidyl aminopeptidase/acylaminoacyl peptidase